MTSVFLAITVLSVVALVATFPIQSSFESRAVLAQRVLPSDQADLFGDQGDNIGTPQKLIVDDSKAFLSGEAPGGAKLVNEKYLQDHKIYPLQLQTVLATLHYGRIGASVAALLAGFLSFRLLRKVSKH